MPKLVYTVRSDAVDFSSKFQTTLEEVGFNFKVTNPIKVVECLENMTYTFTQIP
jgi:hypothetical protein